MEDDSFIPGNTIMGGGRLGPGNLVREDGKRMLFVDNKEFEEVFAAVENNSMFFHENSMLGIETDSTDDFSTFQYSLRAPSFLSPPDEPLQRLNSTEMIAQKNISQYFKYTTMVDENNDVEKQEVKTEEDKELVADLTRRDSIFGSIVCLIPEKPTQNSEKVDTASSLQKDKSEYRNKLLGIEDSMKRLGSDQSYKADTTEYPEPTKKKHWFDRLVFVERGVKKDSRKGKRISPIIVSPLSRKAPLTKTDSAARRGSF